MTPRPPTLSYNQRRALGFLSQEPRTKLELSVVLGLTDSGTVSILRTLRLKGLVFRSGMRPNHATAPSPVYATHAPHALPEHDDEKARTGKTCGRLEQMHCAIDLNGPMTAEDLAHWLEVDQSIINASLAYHRDGGRDSTLIRIASWTYIDGARRGWTAQYGRGPGHDLTKPKVDKLAYMAAWREKNRAKLRLMHAARRQAAGVRVAAAENPFTQLLGVAGVVAHPRKGARKATPELESA